ncbi:retinol dehydrogenase 11-like [Diabrotica virgifera virgifera]|uniref:Retinol dehydrogenase 11-like n=1 Tax=Diabrotica virgifera virgifera TaxID=50390 RepID=A0ABM5KHF5_DIAVI|nr:retinol dehydrogenase 11-like [Diabrotica virgifera virgifera]
MGSIFSASCDSEARLDGKNAVITGANTGIGKETAKDFYVRGGRVILACRNIKRANEAIEKIKAECIGQQDLGELLAVCLDLSSLKSVRSCAEELLKTEKQIHILVNNAGLFGIPYGRSKENYELNFATNHLGHFLFTLLLLPIIIKSGPARIVTVSSRLHTSASSLDFSDLHYERRTYGAIKAYSESKLANILFMNELARKLKEKNINNVNVYSLHPGLVRSEVGRNLDDAWFPGSYWIWSNVLGLFAKSPKQGAQTSIYCSVDEKCANETGLYYAECAPVSPSQAARNETAAKELWEVSWKLVGLKEDFNPFRKL